MPRDTFGDERCHLLNMIAGRIALQKLRWEWPEEHRGGWGTGRTCAACDEAIVTGQAEVEAGFRDREAHQFHARSFREWWRLVASNPGRGAV
jgi:hypothetical protein